MMQQLNQKDPDNYLIAMRILFAPIGQSLASPHVSPSRTKALTDLPRAHSCPGLMLLFFLVVPESPWFHARRGQRDKAMKCLHRLYDGVPDYDFEEGLSFYAFYERLQLTFSFNRDWYH